MRRRFSAAILASLFSTLLQAQDGPGGMAGAPFRMGFDARSIGMGNAVSSLPLADNASAYNPSLLPFVTATTVHLGGALLPLDRSVFHLSYTTSLPPSAGLSVSASGARVGNIQGRDINGTPTELYSSKEYMLAFAFGLQPAPRFAIGAGAKLLHARLLPELTSTTVGLDFGASYLIADDIAVAVTLRDVNSRYRWDTTPLFGRNGNNTVDRFPRRFIVGASWMPSGVPFVFAAEGESIAGIFLYRLGVSYSLHERVTLRAGADGIDPERRTGTRLTFGLSLGDLGIVWNPSLDYAFIVEPFLYYGSHFLTIRFHIQQ